MLPVEFLVTAANFSERKALVSMLKAGVTYIADRGYIAILNELWCKIPIKFSGLKNKLMEKFHKLMFDRFKAFKLKKMLANPLFS